MTGRIAAWLLPPAAEELQGFRFAFGAGLPLWAGLLLVLALGLAAGAWAFRGMASQPAGPRAALATARGLVIALAAFLVLDPTLIGYQVRPSDQTVAVVFDDSRSMGIIHTGGRRRGELVLDAWRRNEGELERRLGERFRMAVYGMGETAYRVSSPDALTFDARESRIADSLQSIAAGIGPDRLAGILLLSDGVEQGSPIGAPEATAGLHGVPVYAGLLPPVTWSDLEVGAFRVPETKFVDVPVVLDVPLRADGLAGEKVVVERIEASDQGEGAEWRVVDSRTLDISRDSEDLLVRFEFLPDHEGWIAGAVRARLAGTPPGSEIGPVDPVISGGGPRIELIAENNEAAYLLDRRPGTYKILFFSGRPGWENAFIRRALSDDRQLAMTTHVRISDAEKKFVFRGRKSSMSNRLFEGFDRDGVDPPRYDEAVFLKFGRETDPLSAGYPERTVDLFVYDLVMWSDVEYDFFNPEQVKQTREFVRKRGGSLLMLGGADGFAAANFAGTIVEGMLPVLIPRDEDEPGEPSGEMAADWNVEPTLEGELDGLLALSTESADSRELWREMPPVAGLNRFSATRPAATVLARASHDGNSEPFYVVQRYGEGRTAALATGTTWFWKMQREANDTSHERIWRQLVRDLVMDAPDPIRLHDRRDAWAQDMGHPLTFQVRDAEFEPRESLQVEIVMTAPSGATRSLPVEEAIDRPGVYTADWLPEEPGPHALRLTARTPDGETVGEIEDRLQVNPDHREFVGARPDAAHLERLAKASGGEVVPLESLLDVVDKLRWRPPDEREALRLSLWHLPQFYVLLAVLLCGEWVVRRRRGLA